MKFDNDIFISYAHLDNQPLKPDAEGWVSHFHHALEVRVDQLLGKKSSVWRDPKVRGVDHLRDAILNQLSGVAVLVSVFTPRYIQSESCREELRKFCEASEKAGGLRVLDKTRVFKVLKTPVPPEQHPPQVRECLGYEFFRVDPDSGHVRELNEVFGEDLERDFWFKLDDLAQDLCELLRWMEDGPPRAHSDPAQSVFLADCTGDMKDEYDLIKRDLLGSQCNVLPDASLSLSVSELVSALKEQLAKCRLSVHIIGQAYGVVPEGTDRSIVELEADLAMERVREGELSRLVWIPPGLEVLDERQRRFIERLRSSPRPADGADHLETSLEELKTQIHRILEQPLQRSPAQDDKDREIQHVYLMCDSRDSENVTPVADYLYEQGCEVTLPAFRGDEADVRADHEENLRSADGILIYYGAPNELWLRSKLRERRKSAGLGRKRPFRATAILVAPPNSQQETRLRLHDARVIHQRNEFTRELLEPFLADLRT